MKLKLDVTLGFHAFPEEIALWLEQWPQFSELWMGADLGDHAPLYPVRQVDLVGFIRSQAYRIFVFFLKDYGFDSRKHFHDLDVDILQICPGRFEENELSASTLSCRAYSNAGATVFGTFLEDFRRHTMKRGISALNPDGSFAHFYPNHRCTPKTFECNRDDLIVWEVNGQAGGRFVLGDVRVDALKRH